MATADWELNLFTSDPTLLERASDEDYERTASALAALADARRVRLLHAISVGEDTALRAAGWAAVSQTFAERELNAMVLAGLVTRNDTPQGPAYAPRDGHLVVQLFVALSHGRERPGERHPRLLARRRPARLSAQRRAG